MKKTSKAQAESKAKLIRNKLRQATHRQVSPQAQAVLAIMVAESWPVTFTNNNKNWQATIGYPMLAVRLGCSKSSAKRWANELWTSGLVLKKQGGGREVTKWLMINPQEGAPMTTQRAHP